MEDLIDDHPDAMSPYENMGYDAGKTFWFVSQF